MKAPTRPPARTPRLALALLALIGAAVWAFFSIAGEVSEGETRAMDQAMLLWLRTPGDLNDPIGPGWLEVMVRDFTGLGGVGILSLVVLATAGWFLMRREVRTAGFVVLATTVGMTMSSLFKSLYERPRPDLVPHGTMVSTASFPSGHSMMSAVVWLTVALVIARSLDTLRLKVFVVTVAVFIVTLVGISRVYLGVHWPTDVIAGWSLGSAWALLCAVAASWLGRHRQIEPQAEDRKS